MAIRVSIHAPAWGATHKIGLVMSVPISFNPRTRVGCDRLTFIPQLFRGVFQSTHPRGVRRDVQHQGLRQDTCFNPRTRVGCDLFLGRSIFAMLSFNPRTRVGCDSCYQYGSEFLGSVSIHAPAWGATPPDAGSFLGSPGFNPRTRVGCDVGKLQAGRQGRGRFQSTHPRGVRRNSQRLQTCGHLVSIHAPAWGATFLMRILFPLLLLFQSTHPRGVRPAAHGPRQCRRNGFNPRTRVGCDRVA